jgi:alpha-glucosidase
MKSTGEPRPSEVIYQVYPSSFNDSNADGLGDIPGITKKLDYIKSLGVEAIWISPFYLSPPGPEGDGGYAVSDYRSIDPRFGTMDDFKALLKEAHARGLRIYTDWVVAHTALDHEWFEKSQKKDEQYKDYYVWADAKEWNGKRVPPNNWKSVFGGDAWTYDEKRKQYYLHHFLNSQPALNLNKKEVQDAVMAEMKFWLDMGVDGFRIDAIPFANYDPELRDNPWRFGSWPNVTERFDQQRHDHDILQAQTIEFIVRIRQLMDSYPQKKTTLGEVTETPNDGKTGVLPVAAGYTDRDKGLDMCYTFVANLISQQTGPEKISELIRELQKNFPNGGHCLSIGNHDSARTFARTEANVPAAQRLAAHKQLMQLFFTLPGNIVLYQGEELALPQARIPEDIPEDKLRDITAQTKGMYVCRDGSRTPMPWESGKKNAGFSPSDEPYLPVPVSHDKKAVDVQEKDPDSMLNFMRGLTEWRKNQPALVKGTADVLKTDPPVLAFVRRSGEQALLCVFNLSGNGVSFKPSDVLDETTLQALGLKDQQTLVLEAYGSHFGGERLPKLKIVPTAPPPGVPPPINKAA